MTSCQGEKEALADRLRSSTSNTNTRSFEWSAFNHEERLVKPVDTEYLEVWGEVSLWRRRDLDLWRFPYRGLRAERR